MKNLFCLRLTIFLLVLSVSLTDAEAQTVVLLDDGHAFPIEKEQTQTELKPGWQIVDIKLKSKVQRYLWGTCARQYSSSRLPRFVVNTDTLLLSDMVLIRLKAKREYRRIPKPVMLNNKHTVVDLTTFSIEPEGEESFVIQPLQPLAPGEYIFAWTTAPVVGELDDWYVWPFSIR